MSPPNTPNDKVPWINRQLNKIGNKLHKNHSEGKKNNVKEYSAGGQSENENTGREIGFNAFNEETERDRKTDEARVGVVEVPTKTEEEVVKQVEPPAASKPSAPAHDTSAADTTASIASINAMMAAQVTANTAL